MAKGLDEDPDNGCLHHYILFSSTVPLLQVGIYTLLPPPFEPTECPVSCGFRSTPILFASLMTRPTTPTGREGQFYYIFNYGTFAWVTALNIHSVRAHSPLIMTVCPPNHLHHHRRRFYFLHRPSHQHPPPRAAETTTRPHRVSFPAPPSHPFDTPVN